jgi:hypothetical protein
MVLWQVWKYVLIYLCLSNQNDFNITVAEDHDTEGEYMEVETRDENSNLDDEPDENSYFARAAWGLHDAQESETVYLSVTEKDAVMFAWEEQPLVEIFDAIVRRQ